MFDFVNLPRELRSQVYVRALVQDKCEFSAYSTDPSCAYSRKVFDEETGGPIISMTGSTIVLYQAHICFTTKATANHPISQYSLSTDESLRKARKVSTHTTPFPLQRMEHL